ncbi:MAG: D-alanine--D-alanine ligase [Myxococcales bacterium]|nr:D-alanine--D-alanine ligase [Myxococcales bacterium]
MQRRQTCWNSSPKREPRSVPKWVSTWSWNGSASVKTKRIAVLMGGPSCEREVSLGTGQGVFEALQALGYQVQALDWKPGEASLPAILEAAQTEVVWNALHGTFGEDGAVQGMLQCMGIACTGSGVLASALAMDKIASKRVFESHSIATPPWQIWQPGCAIELPFPIVIKPANEGSSVGVSVVRGADEVDAALALASEQGGPVLIEEYIEGHEVFVGILGRDALGTIEVRTSKGFYDYEAKYERDDTEYLIPAELPEALCIQLIELALGAHHALGCESYSRVDIRVRESGDAFVLEVNTLPGMTGQSLMPKVAKYAGVDYPSLCERILLAAR